jgi:polyisoprenoid-binding protein YceI
MTRHPFVVAAVAIVVVMVQTVAPRAAAHSYRIDPAASHATIHVGKAGAFSFLAGHTHEVTGPVENGSIDVDLDAPSQSHVRLVIASAGLRVSPAGEPEGDAPKVQETMLGEKVLDVPRYPQIVYESTAVTVKSRRETTLDLVVTGQLTIRDVSQPVTVPVRVVMDDRTLTATGRFSIKQSGFGIKPISVGGVVAVKDTLDIDFSIAAKQ